MADSPWEAMVTFMASAHATENARRRFAAQMAGLLRGNLRYASGSDLAALKKELRDFNCQTHSWKTR